MTKEQLQLQELLQELYPRMTIEQIFKLKWKLKEEEALSIREEEEEELHAEAQWNEAMLDLQAQLQLRKAQALHEQYQEATALPTNNIAEIDIRYNAMVDAILSMAEQICINTQSQAL